MHQLIREVGQIGLDAVILVVAVGVIVVAVAAPAIVVDGRWNRNEH